MKPAAPDSVDPARDPRREPTRYDLGREPGVETQREHIPWSYGHDRVTAMPVDPEQLYVYWEVTDDAIARAREGLGAGGDGAWLGLRVYDVTGRIFDGTNAHAYFDHRVERHDRQWFLSVGRPGSTVCVDLGMKSLEGFFVRIARSSRVDFPRAAPAPSDDVQWMSVRQATGEIEGSHTAAAPQRPAAPPWLRNGGAPGVRAVGDAPLDGSGPAPADASPHDTGKVRRRRLGGGRDAWREELAGPWHEIRRSHAWLGDVEHTSWEAGPFPYPVEAPPFEVIERRSEEGIVVERDDGTHVVEWPWEVTIRGIGAHAERRVLARWEVVRTIESEPFEESAGDASVVVPLGASDRLGASERLLAGASELRFGGASEEYLLGASEIRLRGASERVYAGASERRWLGASERRVTSGERRVGGASEWRPAGASELRLGGASDLARSARDSWQAFAEEGARLAPAAVAPAAPPAPEEAAPRGASERRLGGSERLAATRDAGGAAPDAPASESSPPPAPRW